MPIFMSKSSRNLPLMFIRTRPELENRINSVLGAGLKHVGDSIGTLLYENAGVISDTSA